ncbi:MAG: heme o synthase [Planctomycetales bacterium]
MNVTTLSIGRRGVSWWSRMAGFVQLTKPKIALLELVTVAVAACVASGGIPSNWMLVLHAVIGTALVAASASALNQWLERDSDARMERTEGRPLPAGLLSEREAFWFGAVTMVAGSIYLLLLVNQITALIGVVTWLLYVCVYTPLKSRSSANTIVGAFAGAGPVLMGWTAVSPQWGTQEDIGLVVTLFLIVFFWQFPHFMAIAWIYREQYAKAGARMLTVVEPTGRLAGLQAVSSAALLVPLSVLPAVMMKAGPVYFAIALVLSATQLVFAIRFLVRPGDGSARSLLKMSLVYLPILFGLVWLSPIIFPWL